MTKIRVALALLFAASPLFAQNGRPPQPQPPQQRSEAAFAARPAAPRTGFRAEFLTDLADAQKKIIDLAGAIPESKYGWRPSVGVRSISEVYMHIAGTNYFLASFLGVKPPADIPRDFEKITDKQRVLIELQRSFEQLRNVAINTSDADLEKSVMLFGNPATERRVFVTILTHLHEHLGQSIAYARINGIVPPWSRTES